MGFEYRITLDNFNAEEMNIFLKSLKELNSIEQNKNDERLYQCSLYQFYAESTKNRSRMPDLFIGIEVDGLYCCDNGNGRKIKEKIISRLKKKFNNVVIEEI